MQYHNPILPGMFPDPSMAVVNGTYYLANSTFQYYPGIALSKSTDLLHWTRLPGAATTSVQADLRTAKSNEGIFAVNLRYHNGWFYAITTNFAEFKTLILRGQIQGDSIVWEPTRITVDLQGIDPDLFFEDGHVYIQFTGYIDNHGTKAIQQVEINLENGEILAGPRVLTLGTGGRDVEGPHIIHKNGWYYLLIAEGGTGAGHMITMFRSRELWGPFSPAPNNPLFTNRDRADEPLQSIGHGDLFQDSRGNWWLVCLGTLPTSANFQQFTNTGRTTLLYPVDWSAEWPLIYNGVPTETVDLTDFPKHAQVMPNTQPTSGWQAQFKADELDPEWLSLRVAPAVTLNTGRLTLSGQDDRLASPTGHPSFLGVRQTQAKEKFTVRINQRSITGTGRIGVAVTLDADHYAALLVQSSAIGGFDVFRVQRVFDVSLDEQIGHLTALPTRMTITNTPTTKIFTADGVSFTTDARHFSNEASLALNTGDVQGVYAVGNSQLIIDQAERSAL